jgi:DNA processing protein
VPGPIDSPASAGCLELIRKGATLVRGVDDILEGLAAIHSASRTAPGVSVPSGRGEPPAAAEPPAELDPDGRRVWECLADGPRHGDELAQQLGLAVPELTRTLMLLEMKKAIRRLSGNQYERR